jgi:predicted RNA binding protein YcfA (HicA-like mRNA interferase family)
MSVHLRPYSSTEAIAAFTRAGWSVLPNRGKGHTIMGRAGNPVLLSIPNHRQLKRGLLRSQIRNAGLSVEEFITLAG